MLRSIYLCLVAASAVVLIPSARADTPIKPSPSPPVGASKAHLLAVGVTSTASDGRRYVVYRATSFDGVVVYDSARHRSRRIHTPCAPVNGSYGRFLLQCPPFESRILDAATGKVRQVPRVMADETLEEVGRYWGRGSGIGTNPPPPFYVNLSTGERRVDTSPRNLNSRSLSAPPSWVPASGLYGIDPPFAFRYGSSLQLRRHGRWSTVARGHTWSDVSLAAGRLTWQDDARRPDSSLRVFGYTPTIKRHVMWRVRNAPAIGSAGFPDVDTWHTQGAVFVAVAATQAIGASGQLEPVTSKLWIARWPTA